MIIATLLTSLLTGGVLAKESDIEITDLNIGWSETQEGDTLIGSVEVHVKNKDGSKATPSQGTVVYVTVKNKETGYIIKEISIPYHEDKGKYVSKPLMFDVGSKIKIEAEAIQGDGESDMEWEYTIPVGESYVNPNQIEEIPTTWTKRTPFPNNNVIVLDIEEGEDARFDFGKIDYEVEVLIIEDIDDFYMATLAVNGNRSKQLRNGDNMELSQEGLLLINGITANKAKITIKIPQEYLTMYGEPSEAEPIQAIREVLYCEADFDECVTKGKMTDEKCSIEYKECVKDHSESQMTKPAGSGMSEESPQKCSDGCYINHNTNTCVEYGTRLDGQYCDIDSEVKKQKEIGEKAENPYECETNFLTDGTCESLKEQIGVLKRLLTALKNIFS